VDQKVRENIENQIGMDRERIVITRRWERRALKLGCDGVSEELRGKGRQCAVVHIWGN
jgi:hypothetical protein